MNKKYNTPNPVREANQWCGLVALFVAAVAGGVLTDTLGEVITGVITLVGLHTLRRIYRYLYQIGNERQAVLQTAAAMQSGVGMFDLDDAEPQSLLHHAWRIARYNHDFGKDTDIDAVIREWIGLYEKQVRCFVQLTTLLFSIGLFGTVAGMTISFNAISSGMENTSDVDAVMRSLQDALRGMGTAFHTTLAGTFFGGILLGYLSYIAYSHTDDLVREVKAFMATVRFDEVSTPATEEAA